MFIEQLYVYNKYLLSGVCYGTELLSNGGTIYVFLPSECVQCSLVLAVGQVELSGERVDLLQAHGHPRPVLTALTAGELDTWATGKVKHIEEG